MEQFRHQGSTMLHHLFLIILMAMPLLMQGCTYSTIEKRKASLAMLESTNLVDQKQRFGDLATLDGTYWLQQGKNGGLTIHRFHWEIPGAVMIHRQAFLYNGDEGRWHPDYLNALVLFQFDVKTGELEEIHGTGYPDIEVDFKIPMHVLPSGKVIYNHGNWGWCRCDGENSLVIESASGREVLTPLTEEQYKAALQRRSENYAAQQREVTIEKERRSAERAELIARGLAGLSQGYIEASAQSQQLEDKQHAFLRDLQRDLNNQQIAREQALRAQQQDTVSPGRSTTGGRLDNNTLTILEAPEDRSVKALGGGSASRQASPAVKIHTPPPNVAAKPDYSGCFLTKGSDSWLSYQSLEGAERQLNSRIKDRCFMRGDGRYTLSNLRCENIDNTTPRNPTAQPSYRCSADFACTDAWTCPASPSKSSSQ